MIGRLPESETPTDRSDPTTENNSVTSDETVVKKTGMGILLRKSRKGNKDYNVITFLCKVKFK